jgi:homoserine dehydrogenase
VLEAIAAGKHVVTANKALLAVHGTEIFAARAPRRA